MFLCRTTWGFLNRSPDNYHIFRSYCGPRSARRHLFQCRPCLSKVWYPTVNRFLIRNSLPSTKRKADAKCTQCCYRRPAISYKLLNNNGSMFFRPRHGVHWKRHVHRCSTTRSPPLYALPQKLCPSQIGEFFLLHPVFWLIYLFLINSTCFGRWLRPS